MDPYKVSLNEEKGDNTVLFFECMAEDASHAAEQALNAYPAGEVLVCQKLDGNLMPSDWRRSLSVGDEVWWEDPAEGASSGLYSIVGVNCDGAVEFDDTIIMLKNAEGSEVEAFVHELREASEEAAC